MSRMLLKSMTLENFKGIKKLNLEFNDAQTKICGANATGKTTLVDAFCWVLWNKDSNDNAPGSDAFREKPLDSEGHEIHYLDTMVELACELDGRPFVLKRVQRENWTTKRGFADSVYSGNESSYWVNGVETKLKDFQAKVAEVAPSEVFKLVGKLGAFNSMKWQDRRAALLKLADSDVDAKLLEKADYKLLGKAVSERGIGVDDFRKVLASERKLVNDELKMLPVRIDEAKKLAVDATPEQIRDAEYMMADAQKDIENISEMIAQLKTESAESAVKKQIRELEQRADEIKREYTYALKEARNNASADLLKEQQAAMRARRYLNDLDCSLKIKQTELERLKAEREKLLVEFDEAKNMSVAVDENCPTCGKPLDADKVEAAKVGLIEKRKATMARIREEGKKVAEKIENLSAEVVQMTLDRGDAGFELQKAEAGERIAADELQRIPSVPNFDDNVELMEIASQIDKLNSDSVAAPDLRIHELEVRRSELQGNFNRAAERLATYRAVEAAKNRVRELEIERESKGVQLATVEKLIDLAERFVRERCGALEESINDKFNGIRWKLFDIQINGGLADCCTCMIPCESGLVSYESANTASQVNADISIVKTMSDYYGVKLPLFVDNAERVIKLADADTQVITLTVSTEHTLTII